MRTSHFLMNVRHHRLLIAGLALSLLLILLQVRTYVGWQREALLGPAPADVSPVHFDSPVAGSRPKAVVKKAAPAQVKIRKALTPFKVATAPEQELFRFKLNSQLRDYTLNFSGNVQGANGQSELEISIDPTNQPSVKKRVTTEADGSYSVHIPVREIANEQIDWQVSARGPQMRFAERRGRHILREDSLVTIDSNLQLK
jgi:hypothetical protein